MAYSALTERMLNYFSRQIAFYEELDARMANLPDTSDAEAWEAIAVKGANDQERMAQLEEEFQLLQKEWNAQTAIDPDDHAAVHEQAAIARELAVRVQGHFQAGAAAAAVVRDKAKAKMDELKKGKQVNQSYRIPTFQRDGNQIDNQA